VSGKIAEKIPSLAEKSVNIFAAALVNAILSSLTSITSYVPSILNSVPDATIFGVDTSIYNACPPAIHFSGKPNVFR
jgi:hypothetical protein